MQAVLTVTTAAARVMSADDAGECRLVTQSLPLVAACLTAHYKELPATALSSLDALLGLRTALCTSPLSMALSPNRKGHHAWDKSPKSWQGRVTAAQQWSEDTLRLLTLLCNARRGRPNTEPCAGGPAGGAVHLSLPAAGSRAARARDLLRHRPRAQGGLRAVPPAHAGRNAAGPPAGVCMATEPAWGRGEQPTAGRPCGARCGAEAVSPAL